MKSPIASDPFSDRGGINSILKEKCDSKNRRGAGTSSKCERLKYLIKALYHESKINLPSSTDEFPLETTKPQEQSNGAASTGSSCQRYISKTSA